MPAIEVETVTVVRGGATVLRNVSLSVERGELCVVLGPNGAGKSTLVRVLSGALSPSEGRVRLLGDDVAALDRGAAARRVAVVAQRQETALGFTVREVVMMGRSPHQGSWMRASLADERAVDRALSACGLEAVATRLVAELSGGEHQRVNLARALAQDTEILLLDEASAHLDARHLIEAHELVRQEITERNIACVAVVHDLNLAAQYADRVVLLRDGAVVAQGTVEEVMTYRRLTDIFATELFVGVNELDGARYFLPVRPRSRPPRPQGL